MIRLTQVVKANQNDEYYLRLQKREPNPKDEVIEIGTIEGEELDE